MHNTFRQWIITLVNGICALLLACLAAQQVPDSIATEAHTDIDFSARCDPHSDVVNPSNISVSMAFSSSLTGPTANASMRVTGDAAFDTVSASPHWQLPNRGWVSFVFEGPPLSARYYCHGMWGERPLHLAYEATQNLKLLLSHNGSPSGTELDHQPTDRSSTVHLQPNENAKTVYSAGHGSQNPFWLQVAIPVYLQGNIHTILHNDFL